MQTLLSYWNIKATTIEITNVGINKATITWCDLLPQFFCIDAALLCEFESNKT